MPLIEPDAGPRDTPFHKRIVATRPMPHTLTGHYLDLECGHSVVAFGDLAHVQGVVLCTCCRDEATPPWSEPT